jgi:glycosyltransferase involved in cell wall biosynthesis
VLWPLHPGRFGGEIRDFHLLRRLLRLSEVEFFSLNPFHADGRTDILRPHLRALHTPETLAETDATRDARAAAETERQPRGFPWWGPRYARDAEGLRPMIARFRRAILDAIERLDPDFFFVSPQTNPALLVVDGAKPRLRRIMASYDVEAIRLSRFAQSQHGLRRLASLLEARRGARFERDNLQHFDGVIAVSDLDRDHYVGMYGLPPERVLVLENGADPDFFDFRARPHHDDGHVVFVGALSYLPNEQAAWRLMDRIMPTVRLSHPRARLSLVGQGPSAGLRARHDGHMTIVPGMVPDVRPYLAAASVACIPLTSGSGTKYKIIEALSAGVPVVCTPMALEGLHFEPGRHLLVESTDAGLAGAVVRVLSDGALANRLAAAGRQAVESRYSWDAILPRLDGWLDQVRAMPRRGRRTAV